ncbi:unnamed protein product [Hyaloperonospora brassicae]|uniref:GOLD domain-containing protein n=1 Tax=Hyaloperonospora brassicae TaxID=162125 RepID=A0AAV0TPN8_HYABA|nr:unnamed protein product [Hyaloperonospora brassicae]
MRDFLRRSVALLLLLCLCFLSSSGASRYRFTLTSRTEECVLEEVDARASDNMVLVRFAILEAKRYDLVDVVVKSPTQREIFRWKAKQADFGSAAVRENGLYHLCFRKLKGASSTLTLFYSFDFISTGVRSLALTSTVAATVSSVGPQVPMYTHMEVTTVNGHATKMGVMEFDLSDVSHSIMHSNTHVKLLLTVDDVGNRRTVDIALTLLPSRLRYPVTWESLESHVTDGSASHVLGYDVTGFSNHVAFDITETFEAILNEKAETVAFSIHANENGGAVVIGITDRDDADHFPQIVVEDVGLDLMQELAYFQSSVFALRGDISLVRHRERLSRDAAESANSRVKWMSLITNVVLVGIAFGQVIYIRSILKGRF